jgi:two-component system response regulator AtoC
MRRLAAPSSAPPPPPSDEAPSAFVAVQSDGESYFVDLPYGREVVLGSGHDCEVRIEGQNIARAHALMLWDGARFYLRRLAGADFAELLLHGKEVTERVEVFADDEIVLGDARLAPGVAGPYSSGGRRPLDHDSFRERLLEELARAARTGRPVALAMVRATRGEAALIAKAALETFRAGDVVGVYGPDELELLLPDAASDKARSVVARVLAQAGIADASAGVAVAPDDADNGERLMRAARAALDHALTKSSHRVAIAIPPPRYSKLPDEPVSVDPLSRALLESLARYAAADTRVLFVGEASVGRSVYARWLHDRGPRRAKPFLVVRATATTNDAESVESFLRATEQAFATTGTGTVFIEEIFELAVSAQEGLRALLAAHPHVRVLSSTHRDPDDVRARDVFDVDLFDSLVQARIEIPPLRERPLDIVPLAEQLAKEMSPGSPARFSVSALARLRSHAWPGNALELRNVLERAVRLAGSSEIKAAHLPGGAQRIAAPDTSLRDRVDVLERDTIAKALVEHGQNQTQTAIALGISRRALIHKMEKYGLKPPPAPTRK